MLRISISSLLIICIGVFAASLGSIGISNRRIHLAYGPSRCAYQHLLAVPSNKCTMLLDDGSNGDSKKRTVSPDDLASLFGSSPSKLQPSRFGNEYDDDDDDDDKEGETQEESSNLSDQLNDEDEEYDENKQFEDEYKNSIAKGLRMKEENIKSLESELDLIDKMGSTSNRRSTDSSDIVNNLIFVEKPMDDSSSSMDDVDDYVFEFEYTDLSKPLDKNTQRRVKDALSVSKYQEFRSPISSSSSESAVTTVESSSSSASSTATTTGTSAGSMGTSREVKYNPKEFSRGDPMQYGAYRRWKIAEENGGYNVKGKSRPGMKKKKVSKNPAEKFYDAIKNLGSGPVGGRGASGASTGVADPPANKGPIQPKKAPNGKKTKRVITSDQINNLFSNKKNTNKKVEEGSNDDDNDDDDDDDDDDELEKDDMISSTNTKVGSKVDAADRDEESVDDDKKAGMQVSSFLQPLGSDEIPKWLDDADKAEKKRRKNLSKNKRKKGLTRDWRFWLAIITTVGFASAFYSINQQTGGFGNANGYPTQQQKSTSGQSSDGPEVVL